MSELKQTIDISTTSNRYNKKGEFVGSIQSTTQKTISSESKRSFNFLGATKVGIGVFGFLVSIIVVFAFMSYIYNGYDGFHIDRLMTFSAFNDSRYLNVPTLDTIFNAVSNSPFSSLNSFVSDILGTLNTTVDSWGSNLPSWLSFLVGVAKSPISGTLKFFTFVNFLIGAFSDLFALILSLCGIAL